MNGPSLHRVIRSLRTCASACGAIALAMFPFGACSEGYTSPGKGADLRAFGAESQLDLTSEYRYASPNDPPAQPQANFPAVIAAVRVQDESFQSRWHRAYDYSSFKVVTTRDVETEHDLEKLAQRPMIKAIVPLGHLALSTGRTGGGERALREAARSLGADMLLIYTLDTIGDVNHHVPELSVVTLGLLPEGQARVSCTASAILLDARTGYRYCISEATDRETRLTSAWGSDSTQDKARRQAERDAFTSLIADLGRRWDEIVEQYASQAR